MKSPKVRLSFAQSNSPFEKIKRISPAGGVEFWSARDLHPLLGYSRWEDFKGVIEKAMAGHEASGGARSDHFRRLPKMIALGKGARREIEDFAMTRRGCYLVAMNGSPTVPQIAQAQSYFALQTMRQEKRDQDPVAIAEDEKRVYLRGELSEHNKALASTAKIAGVETPFDYAIFQDEGYKGLYGGLGSRDIHQRKGLKKSEKILDHMGSTELAANLFRATQTEDKLRREKIVGKSKTDQAHREVGAKVRRTIKELGGAMPENLPTADSIKKLEARRKKTLRKGGA